MIQSFFNDSIAKFQLETKTTVAIRFITFDLCQTRGEMERQLVGTEQRVSHVNKNNDNYHHTSSAIK